MRNWFPILVFCLCVKSYARLPVRIWEGTAVRAKSVTLTPFLAKAEGKPATAVIVCPGGSYCWHDMEVEGTEVAHWLQQNGISAFVLKYRVQGVLPYFTHSRLFVRGNRHPDMITDLQRAIQFVREHAQEYHINPHRLGLMGFSAGGHLVMSAAEFFKTDFLGAHGIKTSVSLRPDFVASIYPVVSFSHHDSHARSRRALLGEYRKFKRKMRDSLALEKHVPLDCPPVFLVNCQDDPVVKCHNSELLDSALTVQCINHCYIQYRTGGHGFGASTTKGTAESRAWKEEFFQWLDSLIL